VEENMKLSGVVFLSVALMLAVASIASAKGKGEAPRPTAAVPTKAPAAGPPPPGRYIQTSAQISYILNDVDVMNKGGCCFMSCLGIAQTFAKRTLTALQINTIRESCIPTLVDADMRVLNPAAVINRGFGALGVALSATQVGSTQTYQQIPCDATLIKGTTQTGQMHWVEGSAYGETYYNPYPAAYFVQITVVRYFSISGYAP
jgi:hypothetical protein